MLSIKDQCFSSKSPNISFLKDISQNYAINISINNLANRIADFNFCILLPLRLLIQGHLTAPVAGHWLYIHSHRVFETTCLKVSLIFFGSLSLFYVAFFLCSASSFTDDTVANTTFFDYKVVNKRKPRYLKSESESDKNIFEHNSEELEMGDSKKERDNSPEKVPELDSDYPLGIP